MATGIKDKIVILGMGCSKFGERWDANAEDLIVEAFEEAVKDAGVETSQIEAAWFGTAIEEQHVGKSGVPLAMALRLPYIPVTRVENYCATGTEAFRGACYAVASGAVDIALALGVEKLKDTGYGGLPQRGRGNLNNLYWPNLSAPGSFAQLAAAYRAKHGVDKGDLKRAMAQMPAYDPAFFRVAWIVVKKDLTVEVRSLEIVSTTIFFARPRSESWMSAATAGRPSSTPASSKRSSSRGSASSVGRASCSAASSVFSRASLSASSLPAP